MPHVEITGVRKTAMDSWLKDSAIPVGEISLAWMGQAGFVIKAPELTISIDLYLSDVLAQKYSGTELPHKRMIPPPVAPDSLRSSDLYISSHGHTDHMDPGTMDATYADNTNGPIFICPRSQVEKAVERHVPVSEIVGLTGDESFSLLKEGKEICRVTAIPAAHEELKIDDYGNYEALGYVIEIGGITLYHSGDCVPYEGLEERLGKFDIDVALLPVNGRDEYRTSRGILGNFTVREASALAKSQGISCLIPQHYGMFDFNTIDPAEVEAAFLADGWVLGKNSVVTETELVYTISEV